MSRFLRHHLSVLHLKNRWAKHPTETKIILSYLEKLNAYSVLLDALGEKNDFHLHRL